MSVTARLLATRRLRSAASPIRCFHSARAEHTANATAATHQLRRSLTQSARGVIRAAMISAIQARSCAVPRSPQRSAPVRPRRRTGRETRITAVAGGWRIARVAAGGVVVAAAWLRRSSSSASTPRTRSPVWSARSSSRRARRLPAVGPRRIHPGRRGPSTAGKPPTVAPAIRLVE
jgi:hypothetical protein